MQSIIDQAIARHCPPPEGIGALELSTEGRADAVAVITRQGGFANDQQVVPLTAHRPTTVTVAAGRYAVAFAGSGALTQRVDVMVHPCHVHRVYRSLREDAVPAVSFRDEIARLGLEPGGGQLGELVLNGGEDVDLADCERFADATYQATITDVDRAKALFGLPDHRWPATFSRYGDIEPPDGTHRKGATLSDAARHALREYISGNSATVKAWTSILNESFSRDSWVIPIYLFTTVTVGPCATLRVGSAGLWCDTLRVDPTGTIMITAGPCHIRTSVYEAA